MARGAGSLDQFVCPEREEPVGLDPDAMAAEVSNLTNTADLSAIPGENVQAIGGPQAQKGRRGSDQANAVGAGIHGTPDDRVPVDPQADGPRDPSTLITSAFVHPLVLSKRRVPPLGAFQLILP